VFLVEGTWEVITLGVSNFGFKDGSDSILGTFTSCGNEPLTATSKAAVLLRITWCVVSLFT